MFDVELVRGFRWLVVVEEVDVVYPYWIVVFVASAYNDNNVKNKEQLLKELYKKNKPGCSEVTFKLLGFSLSSLNLMTNIVFLLISAHIYRNEKK